MYYLNDTPERGKAQIEALGLAFDCRRSSPAGGARNALDCALWDLRAKIERKPVWQLLGLQAPQPLRTTYTVGADEPAAMAATARGYTNAQALKLKLTGDGDAERVRAVRAARHDVWLGVDANQGFTRESLERLLPVLEECDVQLIEQPFPVGREADLDGLASGDSDRRRRKRPGLVGPQKPRRAFRRGEHQVGQVRRPHRRHAMLEEIRRLGLLAMVGCMGGTSLSMAPGFVLGPAYARSSTSTAPFCFRTIANRPQRTMTKGHIFCSEAGLGRRRVNARYALEGRRHAVLTEGFLTEPHGKTAHGVIRYRPEQVVAVIDSQYAGKRVCDVVPSLRSDAPIVASVREALAYKPRSLLIGFATDGGAIPPNLRAPIVEAIDAGLDVISGLHEVLADDPAFAALAASKHVDLVDVRVPPANIPLFSGAVYHDKRTKVLAVGSDCAVGKMTAMLEIERAAREAGGKVEFVATGQTGILITGKGIAVDRVISDFVTGAAEQLVLGADPEADVVLVEGQGSIFHPAYAPVTFGVTLRFGPRCAAALPSRRPRAHHGIRSTPSEFAHAHRDARTNLVVRETRARDRRGPRHVGVERRTRERIDCARARRDRTTVGRSGAQRRREAVAASSTELFPTMIYPIPSSLISTS